MRVRVRDRELNRGLTGRLRVAGDQAGDSPTDLDAARAGVQEQRLVAAEQQVHERALEVRALRLAQDVRVLRVLPDLDRGLVAALAAVDPCLREAADDPRLGRRADHRVRRREPRRAARVGVHVWRPIRSLKNRTASVNSFATTLSIQSSDATPNRDRDCRSTAELAKMPKVAETILSAASNPRPVA